MVQLRLSSSLCPRHASTLTRPFTHRTYATSSTSFSSSSPTSTSESTSPSSSQSSKSTPSPFQSRATRSRLESVASIQNLPSSPRISRVSSSDQTFSPPQPARTPSGTQPDFTYRSFKPNQDINSSSNPPPPSTAASTGQAPSIEVLDLRAFNAALPSSSQPQSSFPPRRPFDHRPSSFPSGRSGRGGKLSGRGGRGRGPPRRARRQRIYSDEADGDGSEEKDYVPSTAEAEYLTAKQAEKDKPKPAKIDEPGPKQLLREGFMPQGLLLGSEWGTQATLERGLKGMEGGRAALMDEGYSRAREMRGVIKRGEYVYFRDRQEWRRGVGRRWRNKWGPAREEVRRRVQGDLVEGRYEVLMPKVKRKVGKGEGGRGGVLAEVERMVRLNTSYQKGHIEGILGKVGGMLAPAPMGAQRAGGRDGARA